MKLKQKITIADHFLGIEDPRIDRTKRHNLIDIITIAICAVICGADGWVGIETYGCAKYKWLKKILELPNGIPSHDTFALVKQQLILVILSVVLKEILKSLSILFAAIGE